MNFYNKTWSFVCRNSHLILKSGNETDYGNHSGSLKSGDIVEVTINTNTGQLSFFVNDVDYGILLIIFQTKN